MTEGPRVSAQPLPGVSQAVQKDHPYRVLVTGSRDWPDERVVWNELDDAYENRFSRGEMIIVHGGAKGADWMAHRWARISHEGGLLVRQEVHPARWHQNGAFVRSAGHQRNVRMVELGADLVLCFIRNHSAGATGCMRAAMKAGLEVRVVRIDDEESK
jgi:hypothetical protein